MTNTEVAVPAALMRGGTSKGLYFLASDLPADTAARDRFLLAAMGSPDVREIDGVGGGHPLTSKVAVVSASERDGIDVDYLFLQVWPDRAEVSDQQNCGNILAGVGPFAIERGLVAATGDLTPVAIYMVNTDSKATAFVETPGGHVNYAGTARIDGVPGTHAPININFEDVAGSSCGALLPTGNVIDEVLGVHMIGPSVSEMVGEYCVAMEFRAASEDVARTCHPHPTRSEALRQAAMGVEGWTMQA